MKTDTLKHVLSMKLGSKIIHTDYQATSLHGGTLGNVRLISGTAETADGAKLPYDIVLKVQKKWERYGDPDSWRREFDLYALDLGAFFSDSFNRPKCYFAEMNDAGNEISIWMEYVTGVSGLDMTGDMYERASVELGRFQGKLYAERPISLQSITNLGKIDYAKIFYLHYRSWDVVFDYIRSDNCGIPRHLCEMLIFVDENAEDIFSRIEKLPIVLCHRDFWMTNIICSNDKITLIDWDTAGWGYLGEDLASLIADEADVEHMVEYFQRCVPAYYRGFSEYVDVSHISDNCIRELILVLFGYRIVEWYINAETSAGKALQINTLQKIFDFEPYFRR